MNLSAKIQLAILALAAAIPSANAAENDAAAVFEKAKKSVVVVRVFDADDNQSAQGSGVITAENEVTTNCHVVENISRVEVVRQGEKKPIAAEVKSGDVGRDLCLLSAKGLADAAKIRNAKDLTVGENVYAIGSPQGLEFSISGGIVSQLRALGGSPPLIQTDASISSGSSGGGLFDGEGNLVGITAFYYEDGQNLNFAIPSEWIADARLNDSPFSESAPRISAGSSLDFFDKGYELFEAKNWSELLAHSQKWTKAEPWNTSAWNSLGLAYGNLGRYDDEIAAYREALRINPEYADAWYNLGLAYRALDRYDDAIAAYREALRINREDAKAWYNLGVTYGVLGRYDDATAAYREALRINPELAIAWNNLGVTYYNLERYDDAIIAWREAVRINSEYASAWSNLGAAYNNLNRYDDAIVALREALRINPEFAIAWKNLSIAYRLVGRNAEADEANQKYLRAKILSGE